MVSHSLPGLHSSLIQQSHSASRRPCPAPADEPNGEWVNGARFALPSPELPATVWLEPRVRRGRNRDGMAAQVSVAWELGIFADAVSAESAWAEEEALRHAKATDNCVGAYERLDTYSAQASSASAAGLGSSRSATSLLQKPPSGSTTPSGSTASPSVGASGRTASRAGVAALAEGGGRRCITDDAAERHRNHEQDTHPVRVAQ